MAAFAVAGCGGGAPSESEKVRAVAEAYVAALAERDGKRACALMTEKVQRDLRTTVGSKSCAKAVARATGKRAAERLARAKVESVSVTGTRASVVLDETAGESRDPVRLRKVDERWLVDRDASDARRRR